MNDDRRPERDTITTAVDLTTTDGPLEHCKRASLGRQAVRAAWLLGALVRRVEVEAPAVHRQLHDTVGTLLLLGQQLATPPELPPGSPGWSPDWSPDAGDGMTAGAAINQSPPLGSLRQGELF